MLTNSKIALSVALVLATASAALAAPKKAVPPQATIQQQLPAGTYLSFAAVRSRTSAPSNIKIQDLGYNENLGN